MATTFATSYIASGLGKPTAVPEIRERDEGMVTLTETQNSGVHVTLIQLGNEPETTIEPAQVWAASTTTSPTPAPAAASSSKDSAATALIIMGVILALSLLLFLLCCCWPKGCISHTKKPPSPCQAPRGPRGPRGRQVSAYRVIDALQ
ncbi:hypothetical protein GGR52DRAFT_527940 [Hypoxylon sp. FL1284]|nr:hypothetical protein GGR52DRAFT_527940 [Hypoxylon sp. FL1284]